MEQAHPGVAVQEQEEVLAEEVAVVAEWAEHALERDPVGAVFALVVALSFLIK